MDNRKFFNEMASKWDSMCKHDDTKIRTILELSDIKPSSNILDVGTGTGILISYLLEKAPKSIVAVDIAENMIAVAKEKYKNSEVKFLVADIMDFEETSFDYIFIYSAYPHFTDKKALFKKLHKALNKGGKIVIAHSQSKEAINSIHGKKDEVKNDVLEAVEKTSELMIPYFKVDRMIDTDEMYYISGIKEK